MEGWAKCAEGINVCITMWISDKQYCECYILLSYYNHLIVYTQILCRGELNAASMDGNVKSPLIVKRRLPIVSRALCTHCNSPLSLLIIILLYKGFGTLV